MELKLDILYKEYNQLTEQYFLVNDNINLVLQILEEGRVQQNKISQNSDYINEKCHIKIRLFIEFGKIPVKWEVIRATEDLTNLDQEGFKFKELIKKG